MRRHRIDRRRTDELPAELMNRIDQSDRIVDRCLGQDAVSQIENVSGPVSRLP